MPRQQHAVVHGAAMITLSAASFAAMGVCLKYAADTLNNNMVVLLRNVAGLLFLLPWLIVATRSNTSMRTKRVGMHLLRSLAGLASMYCFFYSIRHLALAEAMLLVYASPLYVPVIAWLWLREQLTLLVVACACLGLIGIGLVIKPGAAIINTAAWIGLASGMLAALAMVSIRRMSDTEPTTRIVFYYSLLCTIISIIPAALTWQTPTMNESLYMAGAGFFASCGQLSITRGYSLAPAGKVGIFSYTTVIFGGLYAWLLWGQGIDDSSAVGIALVLLAAVLMMLFGRTSKAKK